MAGDSEATKRKLGKRFDRTWKLLGRVSMPASIPVCEPEMLFLFKPDEVYPEGYLWPGFTPIHSKLTARAHAVEHFSASVRAQSRARILTLYRNLSYEYTKWQADGRRPEHLLAGKKPPALVVAAPSEPVAWLRASVLGADPYILGVYRGLGVYAELFYVWYYGLDPEERGWDVLRWAVPPHPRSTIDRMRYFEDSTVPVEQKREIWSAIMSEQYAIDIGDNENPYDVVLEKGKQLGIEQGVRRGLEQGVRRGIQQGLQREFESLMQIATRVLKPRELKHMREQHLSAELLDELRLAITDRLD